MNDKTIRAKMSYRAFIRSYIYLWKGSLGLTDKEVDIIIEFVIKYLDYSTKISDPKLLNQTLFSAKSRKEVQALSNTMDDNFYVYISRLKKKNIILTDNLGDSHLNPYIIPSKKITFEFEIVE